MLHKGSCHCGAVKFTVQSPADITAIRCNCSVCSSTGFLHLIVTADDFTLLQGEDNLTLYSFNTHTARHLFCKTCGVKSFYVPRSHPDGYSVNVNCLDPRTITSLTTEEFDGQNWENNINKLT
ncbi:MAG: aldehyde-activating protein [Alphaproteobacteria bacterium]|nr:MAG: aldehyde-activating protein [Alphaproteobacteria bacterium]